MFKDRYGLEVSTSSVEAFDAYADAADRMLAADGQPGSGRAGTDPGASSGRSPTNPSGCWSQLNQPRVRFGCWGD